jgi:hypothetical protein
MSHDEDDYTYGRVDEFYEHRRSMEIFSPDTNTFALLPSSWSIPDSILFPNHHLHLLDGHLLILMFHCPDEEHRPGRYPSPSVPIDWFPDSLKCLRHRPYS